MHHLIWQCCEHFSFWYWHFIIKSYLIKSYFVDVALVFWLLQWMSSLGQFHAYFAWEFSGCHFCSWLCLFLASFYYLSESMGHLPCHSLNESWTVVFFLPLMQQQVLLSNSTSQFPVNSSLMIGDYVTPGNILMPTGTYKNWASYSPLAVGARNTWIAAELVVVEQGSKFCLISVLSALPLCSPRGWSAIASIVRFLVLQWCHCRGYIQLSRAQGGMLWTGGFEAVIISPPQVQRRGLCTPTVGHRCTVFVTSEYGLALVHTWQSGSGAFIH